MAKDPYWTWVAQVTSACPSRMLAFCADPGRVGHTGLEAFQERGPVPGVGAIKA
jgi:hypothetical protein